LIRLEKLTMKTLATNLRLIACSVLIPLALGFASQASLAQSVTVSVSPGDLSFGVPTLNPFPTTPPAPISAPDSVTVNITGTGTVTFAGAAIGAPGANLADFVIEENSCIGTITSPSTCQVTLHFSASLAPATTLETATLAINSGAGNLSVPLNGAYGAIKFFGPLNINPSLFSFTTWTQIPPFGGEPVRTNTVNLSCPAGATAVLSSTPDGLSNVFQDNTIQFANTINNVTTTTTNVCTGGDPNFSGFTGFPAGSSNCFQPAYENAVTNYLNPPGVGQNPDLTGFPFGVGQPGSFIANYGVAPLNVSALLTSNQLQSISIQQQDAGGDLGAATLHLATNCSLAGVTPGGSITGNPITTGNTASQTQSFPFDNGGGQSISYTTSVSTAIGQGTVTVPNGVIPIVTDVGIPQDLFSQLVASTSAAPAVCLRHTGEVDSHGNAMCKGYLIQCQFTDSNGNTTVSGDNCVPTLSTARNLFDLVQFSSPDAPLNGTNYLYNSSPNACSNALPGGACATGTGPGLLMGSDNWPCAPGQVVPCTPQEPDTTTSQTPPTYSSGNCSLTGSLTGDLCPLDTLTQIKGAADIPLGGTTPGKNSIFIPVVNMPLPSTVTTITNQLNGWVKSPAANVNFTSNPAAYSPSAVNPPANSFAAAHAYGVTYGITPANTPVPDPTYPVSGDTTLFNPTANPGFATPLCSPSTTASFSPSPVSISPGGDGIYNLHFFTTDCALTEELLFTPTGSQLTDPTANWASFRFLTFGIDTVAPTFTCNSPSSSVWYNKNQTVSCTATDQGYVAGVSGSGFSPLLPNSIQGSASENLNVSTNVAANSVNSAAPTNSVPACDLAGNCVNVSAGPFMIDLQAPTISGPTLSSSAPANGNIFYVNGPPVTVTYSCSDGAGSGIATCSGPQASGTTINTTTTGNFTFAVTATDLAGNQTTSSVKYTVATAPSADLAVFELPLLLDLIERGTTGHAYPAVVNLSSSTANNVVITTVFTVPNKVLNGSLTATAGLVGCTIKGCTSVPNSGTTCSVSTTVGTSTTTATVTCNVGQLASVSSGKGEVVSINIPILSTATVNTQFSSVTTVTSDNDPKSSNNSASEIYLVIK
jgi:hypothetical protein